MTRAQVMLLAGCCALVNAGCAATTARQSMGQAGGWRPEAVGERAGDSRDNAPYSLPPTASSLAAQQSGQGNVTGQVDASGWKGIEVSSAVPVGQVILMGLMLWFSHRREMTRIRQNGKHAVPLNGEIAT